MMAFYPIFIPVYGQSEEVDPLTLVLALVVSFVIALAITPVLFKITKKVTDFFFDRGWL
jgi:multidrug efflux pump subunit AcrB